MESNLLEAWANWKPQTPPYVLDGDKEILISPKTLEDITIQSDWEEAYKSPEFCAPGDKKLHLGLLPQPFFGDLRCASIYILLLNPGYSPADYYGENEVPEYREALLANLNQGNRIDNIPFLFLEPRFSWHSGFDWWHTKLAEVIHTLACEWQIPFSEARTRLSSQIAAIELMPYHSSSFSDGGNWLKNLQSTKLARAFVNKCVIPRVQFGEAIVIVTRKVKIWNLKEQKGVILYNSAEARGAHLTPGTRGGKAILKHFGVKT